MSGYARAALDSIPPLAQAEDGFGEWRPVRHHFGIRAFGTNAWVAREAGEVVIEEHDETSSAGVAEHEELYAVVRGSARFTIDGESFDAAAGELVHVEDPAVVRGAVALEPGTAILAIGAARGVPFEVSPWERKHLERA